MLSGLVERVTYHNPENGFCVLPVSAEPSRPSTLRLNASPYRRARWNTIRSVSISSMARSE